MAWNPSPKVADLRTLAAKWGCDQLVALAIYPNDTYGITSCGKTPELCAAAKKINDHIRDEIDAGMLEIDRG